MARTRAGARATASAVENRKRSGDEDVERGHIGKLLFASGGTVATAARGAANQALVILSFGCLERSRDSSLINRTRVTGSSTTVATLESM